MQVELSNTTIRCWCVCFLILIGQFTAYYAKKKRQRYTPIYKFGSWSCRNRIVIRSLHTVSCIVDRSSAQYDIQPNLRGCIYEGKKDTS